MRLRIYRELQVWEKLLNLSVKGRLFGTAMFVIPGVQIASSAAFITFKTRMDLSQKIFIAIFAFDAIVFPFVVVSFASHLVGFTRKWLEGSRKCCRGDKYLRRVVSSMRPLRVEFRSNYADQTT